MSELWAVIVGVILLMIVYGYLCEKLKERNRRKFRKNFLPFIEDTVRPDVLYTIGLSDGRRFERVRLVGCSTADDGHFSFFGWDNTLILKLENDKRIFLKQSAVRYIQEC